MRRRKLPRGRQISIVHIFTPGKSQVKPQALVSVRHVFQCEVRYMDKDRAQEPRKTIDYY